MGTRTLLTLEQFFELPEPEDGSTYELDHGELIVLPPPTGLHEVLKNRICARLILFLQDKNLGEAWCEVGLGLDEESWRRPDVSFFRAERLTHLKVGDEPLQGPPDLAIEIYSPSDSIRVLNRKIRHYLEAGTHTVWMVYPWPREVQVVTREGDRWVTADELLECPDLLPGFSVKVRDLVQI